MNIENGPEGNQEVKKYLIDTDCGIDDAECIFTCLYHLDVVAITTVMGNTTVENSATNVAKVLEFSKREVPIYVGCEHSIIEPRKGEWMSNDGLGDIEITKTIEGYRHMIDRKEHAVNAIIRYSKEVKDLNLIFIGPLTNLALAFRMDPGLKDRIASLTIMGGTYKGIGNITFNTEFNFNQDPEAAYIVLSAGFPNVTLVPWETCLKTALQTPEQISKLYDASTPLGQMHKQSADFMAGLDEKYILVDGLTAVIIIDETAILEKFEARGLVNITPGTCKGALSLNSSKSMGYQLGLVKEQYGIDISNAKLTVITNVDVDKAIEVISSAKAGLNKI